MSRMEYYEILGLDVGATETEITARYNELKTKYGQDRWKAGEEGNNAAKMLEKIDFAYAEIMKELNNQQGYDVLSEIANLIKQNELVAAQTKLDNCNERGGEWHYLQSVIFFRKNWMNESKKQLEIALQLDPQNEKYRDALNRIDNRMNYQNQSAYAQGESSNQSEYENSDAQMGGTLCGHCAQCLCANLCFNCALNMCCGCRE